VDSIVSPRQSPLVSIVTPSFNMATYLAEAIESVLSQDYPSIEYIVMDGGSTDGTKAILERYRDRLRLSIAHDKGPTDAVHQGFSRAKGEIFAWLNADDLYLPGAVSTAVDYLKAHPDVDVIYGEANWIDERGAVIRPYPTLPFDEETLARDCFICQPSAFIRASAYRRCGLDPEVNHSFDYDLWIRMAKQGFRFANVPQYLACSRIHGGSKTIYERNQVFQNSIALLSRHYGYVPFPWVFGYTAFRMDGRDQFFEPLRPSLGKYFASLPAGLRLNPSRPWRFLGEWITAPLGYVRRGLRVSKQLSVKCAKSSNERLSRSTL
jgi:glycosyltransferase involved in cell wall biosynthesis